MTVLTHKWPTYKDITDQQGPDGQIGELVEMMSQVNEVFLDAHVRKGNLANGHETTLRTAMPSASWRAMYGGTQPSTGGAEKIVAPFGECTSLAEIDAKALRINGNSAGWLLNENSGHIEAMAQEISSMLFYGNSDVIRDKPNGFSRFFNDQSAENGRNIITSATTPDSTDNASIWVVCWGPDVFIGYPEGAPNDGMQFGIRVRNFGEQWVDDVDGAGGRALMHRTYFEWNGGLVIRDWRKVVRINFDLEDVTASGSTGPVIADLVGKALRRLQGFSGNKAIYCNTDVLDAWDLQANNKSTLAFARGEDADGRMVDLFRGVPLRRCDALLSTEAGL